MQKSRKGAFVATIKRRLSTISWNYAQHELTLDRRYRHIATVLAGIRNSHAAPPRQKEAILPEDLIAMLETLDRGKLQGLHDRAMLLIGFAGSLRRSEIVALDAGHDQTEDGRGWIEILDRGLLVMLRGKTGWREVEIARLVKKTVIAAGIVGDLPEGARVKLFSGHSLRAGLATPQRWTNAMSRSSSATLPPK